MTVGGGEGGGREGGGMTAGGGACGGMTVGGGEGGGMTVVYYIISAIPCNCLFRTKMNLIVVVYCSPTF